MLINSLERGKFGVRLALPERFRVLSDLEDHARLLDEEAGLESANVWRARAGVLGS